MADRTVMTIHLGGYWTLAQLESFLSSVNNLYRAVVAIESISSEYERILEARDELGRYPFWEEYFRYFQHYSKRHGKRPPIYFTPFGNYQEYGSLSAVLRNNEWPIPIYDELILRRIEISSPGEICIEAGGLLKELRELIKDLAYRNDQERREGELRIIDKMTDIMIKGGVSKPEISRVQKYLFENGKVLVDLKSKGLLGEQIDIEV